jgi:CheY-like chemotaxis protein
MTSAPDQQGAAADGKRVLIVEDELMIRMLLADMLGELGYAVAGEAARIDEALAAAKIGDFDLAILDVNLNGESVEPVAVALSAQGCPFIFASGYGARGLPEAFRDRPTLRKPFQMPELSRVLQDALAGKR